MKRLLAIAYCGVVVSACAGRGEHADLRVGSKRFTESVILGEMLTLAAREHGLRAVHSAEMGSTQVMWKALQFGGIDVYPEYVGTLREEIFAGQDVSTTASLRDLLRQHGVSMSRSLGFSNGYALAMKKKQAEALGVRTISDLKKHLELRFALSSDFLERPDGFRGLAQHYSLSPRALRGMDHDLTYRSIESGAADVIDVYATDAEIDYYHLVLLKDDRGFFGDYVTVLLYRQALKQNAAAMETFGAVESSLSEDAIRRMNGEVKVEGRTEATVAAAFLREHLKYDVPKTEENPWVLELWQRTVEHVYLVAVSLALAIALAVPLGVVAHKRRAVGKWILSVTGIVQTVPSLALLVFMIPLFGAAGELPAIAALFLYSLLPVVRNTYAGLSSIPDALLESAVALGLSPRARLLEIELPLAAPSIVAGIKTSAVINIGTATLGALIGAGGYGQPILSGIRLDNLSLILQGAVPAAGLALIADGAFSLLERRVVSEGLQQSSTAN